MAPLALLLSLLASSALWSSSAALLSAPFAALVDNTDVDKLAISYDEAIKSWNAKLNNEARKDKKEELRKKHPILEFYTKFEKLSGKGEGQALLWMATHVQDKFDKDKDKKECAAKKLELFGKLVKDFAGESWSGGIATALGTQGKWLDIEQSDKLVLELAANPKASKDTGAAALASIVERIEKDKQPSDAEKKKAEELRARLLKDYDGTPIVERLEATEFRDKFLKEGLPVPDFTTKDVEDVEFKLSDYKGKVVLLDFWGFW